MMKPKPIVTAQQKAFFLFVCIVVAIIAIALIFRLISDKSPFLRSNESIYSEAYRPAIEQAQEIQRMEALQKKRAQEDSSHSGDDDEEESNQPRPYGFKESEIQKTQGKRYQTW